MENSYNTGSGTGYSSSTSIKKLEIQTNHEKELQKEQHEYDLKCKRLDIDHDLNKHLGWVGRKFGSAENASKNITATLCILLIVGETIVSSIVYYYECDISKVTVLWDGVLPIITLSLGYLFGKK